MVGSRSRWAATVAALFLFAGAGCKCDKQEAHEPDGSQAEPAGFESTVGKLPGADLVDVARLIPEGVDLAIWANAPDKVQAWLEGRGWWKAVVASPLWEDLALSGPLYELSTARHKLASLSPVEFREPKLSELLQGPMAVALSRTPAGIRLLVIKQIDLKVQALARLAEVFNQAKAEGELKSRQVEGIEIKTFALGSDQAVHYALFSNLMLVSNDGGMLEQAVLLASGKEAKALLTSNNAGPLFAKRTPTDLGAYLNPAGLSRWLYLMLPLEAVRLDWRLGETPEAEIFGLAAAPADKDLQAGAGKALAKLIPLESRLVVAHADLDLDGLWTGLQAALTEADAHKGKLPAVGQVLLPALTGEVCLVVISVGLPIPEVAVVLHGRAGALKDAKLSPTVAKTLGLLFGSPPESAPQSDLGGLALWSSEGGQITPAFAVMDDWLVLGSSADAVRAVVATHLGKAPALADRAGFGAKVAAAAEPFYGLTYVDSDHLFGDLLGTTRKLMSSSERFDANDFDDTLAPLFEALKQLGRLGGGLGRTAEPNRVTGRVVAL